LLGGEVGVQAKVLARLTKRSVTLLNLQVGQQVYAQVKGVALLG